MDLYTEILSMNEHLYPDNIKEVMKNGLEAHVCSLEQAKQISALGVNHQHTFTWVCHTDRDPYVEQSDCVISGWGIKDGQKMYPAYSSVEIGIMLGLNIHGVLPEEVYNTPEFCKWFEKQKAETEAQFRAKVLIYSLKKKILTPIIAVNRLAKFEWKK